MSGTQAKNTKIILSAGGTGGHLFPALALAQSLANGPSPSDLLFVGGGLASNRYFDPEAHPFREISCGSFGSKNPWHLAKGCWNILRGIGQSLSLFRQQRPDIVVGFGSFYSFPPLVAACLLRIPIVLYAADALPGRVVRLLAPFAQVTGTHFASTNTSLKGASIPVGMPLRHTLTADRSPAEEARVHYGLEPYTTTLLVFGGSQGAQKLNELLLESLSTLIPRLTTPLQVLHFTGSEHTVVSTRQAYEKLGIRACVKAFEPRMGLAWSAASLVLGRSGAGTIAEIQLFEVPAILVPYPFATDAHQDHNADIIVAQNGGIKLSQVNLTSLTLADHLARLLNDEGRCLTDMRRALSLARQQGPKQTLGDLVWETLNKMKAS